MSHTPGPWTVDIESRLISSRIAAVARACQGDYNPNEMEPEDYANARLIAAAPDLLEAAKGALGYLLALPLEARPDEAWFLPLMDAIGKAGGGVAV